VDYQSRLNYSHDDLRVIILNQEKDQTNASHIMTDSTYLDKILAFHRSRSANDRRSFADLLKLVPSNPPRGFAEKITNESGLSVIAEIKRKSPSKGIFRADLDPSAVALQYEVSGAACISVLTDSEHFGGSESDLQAVRLVVDLPILRKDFTIDPRDICDAKIMGADCVLLIVSALEKNQLRELYNLATVLGMDALVETHDESEIEIALEIGAEMIGVNQRDLQTFKVDQKRALRVVEQIPEDVVKVAESGIKTPSDAKALAAAGYDAVLIGEALVVSEMPGLIIKELKEL